MRVESRLAYFEYKASVAKGKRIEHWRKLARIRRTELRQKSGSQYAKDHAGEPGRNGGPRGQ